MTNLTSPQAAHTTIPVFYSDAMVADAESYSPSARKPKALIARWLAAGRDIEIMPVDPVTVSDICRAHDPDYVRGVLSLKSKNGFGNRLASVAKSLPYTSGSMLCAARWVLCNGGFACAPCSGFHHAHYASGEGFCTFNGLMVTAMALKAEGLVKRVGIVDFDHHYGNGTDDIIDRLRIDWITHYTAGENFNSPHQSERFLAGIPAIMSSMRDCDVVLYQAGADPHINDPLGGWLTTKQLAWRDELVFREARLLGLPVAWNLAGGYQDPLDRVLDIHDNTLLTCLSNL